MARKKNPRPSDIQRYKTTGCDRRRWARGYCKNHYDRILKAENPEYARRQRDNQRRWLERHPEYHKSARQRANHRRLQSQYTAAFRAERLQKLKEQGGKCALCGCDQAANWHYDHDHQTGAMRAVLCTKCNNGLGFFNDDPAFLRKAADYIEFYRPCPPASGDPR